ncbi:MAG: nuclear transport factor 2 family protein [Acidimicrobiia bacterium]
MRDRHPFRSAVEVGDIEAMLACLEQDVVLHSPVLFEPVVGKAVVARLLEVLLEEVFEDFRYTDELTASDGTRGLVFQAVVGDREVEGLDLLRHDAAGLITDFTVMIRPLSGLVALAEAVRARYDRVFEG